MPLIGVLAPGSADAARASPYRQQFSQALRDLGWIEGETVLFERRFAEGDLERLPELAAELVRLKVDVICAPTGSAAVAAMRATQTIPIVMQTGDPFGGLPTNLARPDKNVTGQVAMSDDIAGKRLELLKEALPRASRVAVLWCPGGPTRSGQQWTITEDAARTLKIQLLPLDVRSRDDLQMAFTTAVKQRADGLVLFECSLFNALPRALLVQHRLPAIYIWADFAEAGGLMAYGPDIGTRNYSIGAQIDKILRGAKPSEIPVEQPTKYRLVINLKTAKALGLTIPRSLLSRADEVIE